MASEILASAAVSGAVSLLVNLIIERRREKRADRLEIRKEKAKTYETRPEMAIVGYENYFDRVGDGIKQPCDIELFVARLENVTTTGTKKNDFVWANYCEKDFNPDEWCCVIYKLENKGKTDISLLDIICNNKQNTCIFLRDSAQRMATAHALNYCLCYDKKIRVGETITVKFCYHKDHIISGMFSAIMSIGMEDDNGMHWVQPLFAPENKVYDSRRISHREYRERISTDIAEECFKKPWLW